MPSSVIGPVVGGIISGNASKSAARAQANSATQASNAQLRMYNQSRADLEPYRAAGYAANNRLSYLMGLAQPNRDSIAQQLGLTPTTKEIKASGANPAKTENIYTPAQIASIDAELARQKASPDSGSLARNFSLADYQADPGYQFRLDEGNKAINAAQAKRGNFYSGAALKEANRYNSGMASQEYGSAYDRYQQNKNTLYNQLSGISNSGYGAVNTGVNNNNNNASQLGSIFAAQGQNKANAAINQGNIYSQGVASLFGGGGSSYGNVGAGLSSWLNGTGYGTGSSVYNSVNNPANSSFF